MQDWQEGWIKRDAVRGLYTQFPSVKEPVKDETGHKQEEKDDVNEKIRRINWKQTLPFSQTLKITEKKRRGKRKLNKNVLRQKNRGLQLKLTADLCRNVSRSVSKHDYKVLSPKAHGKTFLHCITHTHKHIQLSYQHHHMSHALLNLSLSPLIKEQWTPQSLSHLSVHVFSWLTPSCHCLIYLLNSNKSGQLLSGCIWKVTSHNKTYWSTSGDHKVNCNCWGMSLHQGVSELQHLQGNGPLPAEDTQDTATGHGGACGWQIAVGQMTYSMYAQAGCYRLAWERGRS